MFTLAVSWNSTKVGASQTLAFFWYNFLIVFPFPPEYSFCEPRFKKERKKEFDCIHFRNNFNWLLDLKNLIESLSILVHLMSHNVDILRHFSFLELYVISVRQCERFNKDIQQRYIFISPLNLITCYIALQMRQKFFLSLQKFNIKFLEIKCSTASSLFPKKTSSQFLNALKIIIGTIKITWINWNDKKWTIYYQP